MNAKSAILAPTLALLSGLLVGGCRTDGDAALRPFPVLRPVPDYLSDARRGFQSAPSVTVAPGGRVWCAWHTGGINEGPDNALVLVTSGDGGATWSEPVLAIDAPGPLRVLDPGLWTDPSGRVWLFYAQLYDFWDGRAGVWAIHPLDSACAETEWSAPRRLCDGYLKNKPTVLTDGSWLLPVEFMNQAPVTFDGNAEWKGGLAPMTGPCAHPSPERMGGNVFRSADAGATVSFYGQASVPVKDRDCTENMVVARKDGTLWMLVRTRYGIGESVSSDGGRTWSEVTPSQIQNPNSRFFVGRLKSGALLLVKNGPVDLKTPRERITAFVSDDDGRTWTGGLVLDGRDKVSYPDAAEDPDGFIHAVNDYDRQGAREILHHRFTEADVRAGRLVTSGSRLGDVVNRAGAKK